MPLKNDQTLKICCKSFCEMSCNTSIDYSDQNDQDEWTPYIAFPFCKAKDRFLLFPMKRRPPDIFLSKNNSWFSIPTEKRYLHNFKTNHVKREIPCYSNGQLMKHFNQNRTSCSFPSKKTTKLWDQLKKSCQRKSRTCWQDSFENSFFLKSLGVSKRASYDRNNEVPMWNLVCTCKYYQGTNSNESNELTESDDECSSPCLCPKYFISKSGLVFISLEEKQSFDEKMDKMDQVFKSELRTIKEQHERLREDFNPKQNENL